jgi:hypothetical protein
MDDIFSWAKSLETTVLYIECQLCVCQAYQLLLSLCKSHICHAHGKNFLDTEEDYKKFGILRSLRYIYSHPFRFLISSLSSPSFHSQKSQEGGLAKYTADTRPLTRQNPEL